ncbi:hypothetical protein [Sulfobacillus sp. hq2]|uniref:hypothetical protein n=1 Tax=Sulfobacillus TaxID=28033 RepID=UPI000CD23288|nr:hypothetical protein [Sulfobacillus sp. hq2]POB11152.1 hypothetical protein CO251_06320 [Sulfobacillus sp. hq2]
MRVKKLYVAQKYLSWKDFVVPAVAGRWDGSGTLNEPWILEPGDDVWGWLDVFTEQPFGLWAVSLEFCYTLHNHHIQTEITVRAEPYRDRVLRSS